MTISRDTPATVDDPVPLETLRNALAAAGDLAGLVSVEQLKPPEGQDSSVGFIRRVALALVVSSVAGVELTACLAATGCTVEEYLEVSESPEIWPALTGYTMGLIVAPRFPAIMQAASMAAMTGDGKAQGMFMQLVQMAAERSGDAALEHVRKMSSAGLAGELRGMMEKLGGMAEQLGARDSEKAGKLTKAARRAVSSGKTLNKGGNEMGRVDHRGMHG